MEEDITKVPLITLIDRLTSIDTQLGMLEVRRDRIDIKLEQLKIEYNTIISEIVRRFPPLENDVNLQPKTLGKKRR